MKKNNRFNNIPMLKENLERYQDLRAWTGGDGRNLGPDWINKDIFDKNSSSTIQYMYPFKLNN